MNKIICTLFLTAGISMLTSTQTLSQGQDSSVPERDIMILAEIFPGTYDNANQAYFDVRLKVDESKRHAPVAKQVHRLDGSRFGDYVFWSKEELKTSASDDQLASPRYYLYSFETDNQRHAVRMKTYRLKKAPSSKLKKENADYLQGCDLLWHQEAGQFRGVLDGSSCALDGQETRPEYGMLLTEDSLWKTIPGTTHQEGRAYYAMDKARIFDCYIDVPGVAGGRDIPFKRYHLEDIHDLGGEKWVTLDDDKELGISLFRVMWSFNNYQDAFARPSFVIYAKTKDDQGKPKEISYAFTSPEVQRLGMNLKWALINCHMIPRQDVTPFYKKPEPRI